jgi:hypothetical protein
VGYGIQQRQGLFLLGSGYTASLAYSAFQKVQSLESLNNFLCSQQPIQPTTYSIYKMGEY